jgi:hypothetical protein
MLSIHFAMTNTNKYIDRKKEIIKKIDGNKKCYICKK